MPDEPSSTTSAPASDLPRRVAVTAAVVALLHAGRRLRLPLLDEEAFLLFRGDGQMLTLLSPLAIGLGPFIAGFLLVETIAQVVPGLRRLRHGSARERQVLTRAAWVVALALASWHGWDHAIALRSMNGTSGDPLLAGGLAATASIATALVLGTLASGYAAVLISRRGLGNGFAVLFGVGAVEVVLRHGHTLLLQPSGAWNDVTLLVGLALVVVVPLVVSHGRGDTERCPRLPALTCGLAVIEAPSVIFAFPAKLASWFAPVAPLASALLAETWPGTFVDLAVVAGMAILFARLFCPPAGVVVAFRRVAPAGGEVGDAGVRRALRAANRRSVALVVGVALVPTIAGVLETPIAFPVEVLLAVAVVIAVASDLRGEVNARAGAPPLASARPLHRVYTVEPALQALAAAGIPAFPRSPPLSDALPLLRAVGARRILVPPGRAAEADGICARIDVPDPTARLPQAG